DHYVAFVVEGDGEHGAPRAIGYRDLIGPAATFHPADGDRAPVAQSVEPGAEQLDVTHAVELGVVRHPGRAIAEAELGAQVEIDVGAAIGGPAAECAPEAPLIEGERPYELGPGGGRGLSRIGRLLPGAERHRAAREHARNTERDHHAAGASCDHFTST